MVALNSKHKTNRKQGKHRQTTKTSSSKEQVEQASLGKPVLKKKKKNFVAPLKFLV